MFRKSFGAKIVALLLLVGLLVAAANLGIVFLVDELVKNIAREWIADASLRAIKRTDEQLALIEYYTEAIAMQTADLLNDNWDYVNVDKFERCFMRDSAGALKTRVTHPNYRFGVPETYPEKLQAFAPGEKIYKLTLDDKKFLLIAEEYSFSMLKIAREMLGTQWVYLVHGEVSLTYPFSDTTLDLNPGFRYSTRPYYSVIRDFDGKGRWTDPYLDASGTGWMMTRAHPIVFRGKPFGMAVQDFKLSQINESLLNIQFRQSEFDTGLGEGEAPLIYKLIRMVRGTKQRKAETIAFILKENGQLLTTNEPRILKEMMQLGGVYHLWPSPDMPASSAHDRSGLYSPRLLRDAAGHLYGNAQFLGDDIVFAYPLQSTGWFVLVQVDAADIFSAIRALIGVLLAVTAGGILIAIGLGYFFCRRFITDRIYAVANAARQVSKGNLMARVKGLGDDEIGQLGKSFNQMMEGLLARQREKEVFGHYLSTTIRDKILKHPDALSGEEAEAAGLFSDIRGFSSYSENKPPQEVVDMLNRHFSRMVKVIQENGGVVEKFIGDAVMAVFSEYFGTSEPHRSAVKAAVAMRRELAGLNAEFLKEGKPSIDIGIGIHAGPVVAGNIGSADRKTFTVIGNTVNVASRLEDITKTLGFPILISAEVCERCGKIDGVRFVDTEEIQVKGKTQKVRVYRVETDNI